MTVCAHCGRRKGKRACPALGAVCSLCCGQHRAIAIACPPDCRHLRGTREGREFGAVLVQLLEFVARSDEPWKRDARASFAGIVDLLDESVPGATLAYLAFGYEDEEGRRGIDSFLAQETVDRSYATMIESLRGTFVSVFEILEVRSELGLRLFDLLGEEEVFLHDRLATRHSQAGTFLLGWLVPLRGYLASAGASCIIPTEVLPDVLGAIEEALEKRGADPKRPPREVVRQVIPEAYRVLIDSTLESEPEALPSRTSCRADYLVEDPEEVWNLLQAHPECRRTEGGLVWQERASPARPDREAVTLQLRTVRLSVNAPSRERLEQGKRFVKRTLGSLARLRLDRDVPCLDRTARPSVASAVVIGESEPIIDTEGEVASFSGEMDRRIRDQLEREEAPPPPEKRRSRSLRSGDHHHLPRLAHEVMYDVQPGLRKAVEGALALLARRSGDAPGAPSRVIHPEDLIEMPPVQDLLRAHGKRRVAGGLSPEDAFVDANLLGAHVFYALNHACFHKKTFWVEEALAWMLSQTSLDIQGQCLQLPFPCSAFVYTDSGTLELCESLLSQDPDCRLRDRQLSCLTVYVIEQPESSADGARMIEVHFLCDDGSPEWPYLLTRSLFVHADDHLDAILDSLVPEVDLATRDPLFSAPELVKLLHLVINSILYCTSAHLDPIVLRPGPPPREKRSRKRRRQARQEKPHLSRDHVLFLPGKIDISHIRKYRALARTRDGRKTMKRFMVRGHWRRANPAWEDQCLRWIEPYWKGPQIGEVVEREYRLRP